MDADSVPRCRTAGEAALGPRGSESPPGGVAGRGVRFKGRAPPPRGRRERRCSSPGLGELDPGGLHERCAEEPGGGGGAEPGRGSGQRH